MSIGTIIMNSVMILGGISPFLFVYRNKRKLKNKLIQALKERIGDPTIELKEIDTFLGLIICLDKTQNRLYYYKKNGEIYNFQSVDINEIVQCKITKQYIPKDQWEDEYPRILKVDLILTTKNATNSEVVLNFYNDEDSFYLSGELQIAEKWKQLISKTIRENIITSKTNPVIEGYLN
jgi:hypothetical protein